MPLCRTVLHQDGAHAQRCIAEALPGSPFCVVHQSPATRLPRSTRPLEETDLPWTDEDRTRIAAVRRSPSGS